MLKLSKNVKMQKDHVQARKRIPVKSFLTWYNTLLSTDFLATISSICSTNSPKSSLDYPY